MIKITETYKCPRCSEHYCEDCDGFQEVDFEIREFIYHPVVSFRDVRDWCGENVCPYCYDQLKAKKKLQEECPHIKKKIVEAQRNHKLELCSVCKKVFRWID